tara:strand:+ start:190 stop:1008 length:819 start_codon:yes stop_codon:yes gene_type:complete
MTKSRGIRKQHKEGDIKIMPSNNTKWRYTNGKWVYVKKPREEWDIPIAKPKEKVVYDYPEINPPSFMKELENYKGYYITESGDAYRRPGKYDRNGQYGEINEWGLIYIKPGLRGNPNTPKSQMYDCINISIKDNNGNYKQIKKSTHQLVAETFVPNPNGYTEILHLDGNCKNNHYTNLKWGTHKENMEAAGLPDGTIRNVKNTSKYIKKDGEWVLIPSNKPPWNKGLKGVSWNTLPDGTVRVRKVNGKDGIFIKQNGEWVYQTDNPKPRKKT